MEWLWNIFEWLWDWIGFDVTDTYLVYLFQSEIQLLLLGLLLTAVGFRLYSHLFPAASKQKKNAAEEDGRASTSASPNASASNCHQQRQSCEAKEANSSRQNNGEQIELVAPTSASSSNDQSLVADGTASASEDLANAVGIDAAELEEASKVVEDVTKGAALAGGLAEGLFGAIRGEETEVSAAVGDVANLGGQLVGALAHGDVSGLLGVVGQVGDRAQKLEALADELGCGDSLGALAGNVTTVTNIINADHTKTAAVVGQAGKEVGSALFGVLGAVGSAVIGSEEEGKPTGFAGVLSACGDAAGAIGSSIGSVAEMTDELAGENNVLSNAIREMGDMNAAASQVLNATGKAVTKIASGEASAAEVVALGADALAGAATGMVAVAGSVVNEMNMAVGAVKVGANLFKAGVAFAGYYAKSAGLSETAVNAVVGAVSAATDTVGVAADGIGGVLSATHDAVSATGELVSAAGKAAVQAAEDGGQSASVSDVLSGMVKGVTNVDDESDASKAISDISGATNQVFSSARVVTSDLAGIVGLGGLMGAIGIGGGNGGGEDDDNKTVGDEKVVDTDAADAASAADNSSNDKPQEAS